MWDWFKRRSNDGRESGGRKLKPGEPPKIVIISDIHGNYEALQALPEDYDELWVLGDLVNYGPQPAEVVDFIRERAHLVLRGNHDHAVAWDCEARCSASFRQAAEQTQKYTASILNSEQKSYLGGQSLHTYFKRDSLRIYACHAVPSDLLYGYCEKDSPQWQAECNRAAADCLFVGHTHVPFVCRLGTCTVVNPGSLGQPKNGCAEACYAVWEDGVIHLRSYAYPVERTVKQIRAMPVDAEVREFLVNVLETGVVPKSNPVRTHVQDTGARRH